jgi:septation ring formation regulator EzrA
MSEARFDRLESQLTQVIQAIGTMQQNIATMQQNLVSVEQKVVGIEQKVIGIEQNVNAVREDIFNLRNRIDSVEGAVSVVIRGTFVAHQSFVDDLNFDLLKNERKTRRLSRRVARLERQELDDD